MLVIKGFLDLYHSVPKKPQSSLRSHLTSNNLKSKTIQLSNKEVKTVVF